MSVKTCLEVDIEKSFQKKGQRIFASEGKVFENVGQFSQALLHLPK